MKKCRRCGTCCKRGDFWWASNHPFLNQLHTRLAGKDVIKEDGPCMFYFNGLCAIEVYFGRDAKPDVCEEYDCESEVEK